MTVRHIEDELSGETLIVDPEIPGQIGWEALLAMARLAKKVPENGVIVETGCLFGRSSFIWSQNAHPSVQIFCIDPWVREQWIIDVVEGPQNAPPFSIDAFREYTKDCKNIETIQGYSPEIIKDKWTTQVDLFFDDGDHDEPGLSQNRDFWTPFIKPGGYFCADEYALEYPDCLRKTHELAIEWKTLVDRVGLFCWMQRPE